MRRHSSIRLSVQMWWHRKSCGMSGSTATGILGVSGLETLRAKILVDGMEVDESTLPSKTCKACIQAKQAVWLFPKEAKHWSNVPGERTLSDVWGPASTTSIDESKYYISSMDDTTRTCATLFLKTKGKASSKSRTTYRKEIRKDSKIPSIWQWKGISQ